MIENGFEERREYGRMNVVCPVTVYKTDKELRELIRNMSASGLKIETKDNLALNRLYNFEFTLPEGPSIRFEGEVCWRTPKGEAVYYGIKIKQLGVLDRIRLRYFLNRRIRNIKKKIMEEQNGNS